jgi:hypothetical protein
MQQSETSMNNLVSPNEIVMEFPNKFTKGQLIWLFRQRHKNGLQESGAALLISRRPYFNKQKLIEWFLAQNK